MRCVVRVPAQRASTSATQRHRPQGERIEDRDLASSKADGARVGHLSDGARHDFPPEAEAGGDVGMRSPDRDRVALATIRGEIQQLAGGTLKSAAASGSGWADTLPGWFYCYDARDQLVARNTGGACTAATGDETYAYDDAGNRLTATQSGTTRTFAYDAEGRYAGATHDASGRIIDLPDWHMFEYDAEGRLISLCDAACSSGSTKLDFTYDADGRRTKIVTSGGGTSTTTELRYADGRVSAEYTHTCDISGYCTIPALSREYVTDESGAVIKMIVPAGQANAGTYFVTYNGHGDALNLIRVAKGSATLANSFRYDTWGSATVTTHNGMGDLGFRFRYVGQFGVQDDAVHGLPMLLMGARHYSPSLGRFLQPDPTALEENHYAYAGNNPVTYADPTGACWWCNLASQAWNWLGARGWPVVQSFLGSAWNWINRTGAVPWVQRNWTLLHQGAARTAQGWSAVSRISSARWNYIMTRPQHDWARNGVSQQRVAQLIAGTLMRNGMQMTAGRAFAVQSGGHWINWGFKAVCVTGFVTPWNTVIVGNAWIITHGCSL